MNMEETYKSMLKQQYELNTQLVQGIERIADMAERLTVLAETQNSKIDNNTMAIAGMSKSLETAEKTFGKIFYILVIAIVILAGAEKAVSFIAK